MQMFENSSNTSPELLELLKRTADFSLNADEMKTKYLLVRGVRVRRGSDPRYSFCWQACQPPQRTLQKGSEPVQ